VAAEPLSRMVRRLRLDADLTLERLSEASGISDRALSDIERGAARGPQHRTVLAIATALGLSEVDRAAMVRAARDGRRRATPSSLHRLPLPLGADHFTRRGVELAKITAAMTGPRHHRPSLIVVTGPPGYAKTSLAVRAATLMRDAFPEQLFVQLGGLASEPPSPDVVVTWIVRALSGRQSRSGDVGLLRQLLVDRRVLLVLDDAAYESQVRAVLPPAGPGAVLVTSRRSLAGLDGAERLVLDRLRSEDAQQLLAAIIPPGQRAGADLADLARLCDNVPLALRLAGNRLASRPGWTVMALMARLAVADRRLNALTAGDLGTAAAISVSFAQLSAGAQQLDGSTIGAGLAGALIGRHSWQAEELLDELADLSFVQPTAGDRYVLHELLRLYATAELVHEPLATRAAIRVAADDWLLSTAVRAAITLRFGIRTGTPADPVFTGTPLCPESARAWLTDEAENWSAALARVMRRRAPGALPDLAEVDRSLDLTQPTAWRPSGQPPEGPRPHAVHLPSPRPATHVRTLREVPQLGEPTRRGNASESRKTSHVEALASLRKVPCGAPSAS
jgi:transcriptional regulator with XRE-family HTH domain